MSRLWFLCMSGMCGTEEKSRFVTQSDLKQRKPILIFFTLSSHWSSTKTKQWGGGAIAQTFHFTFLIAQSFTNCLWARAKENNQEQLFGHMNAHPPAVGETVRMEADAWNQLHIISQQWIFPEQTLHLPPCNWGISTLHWQSSYSLVCLVSCDPIFEVVGSFGSNQISDLLVCAQGLLLKNVTHWVNCLSILFAVCFLLFCICRCMSCPCAVTTMVAIPKQSQSLLFSCLAPTECSLQLVAHGLEAEKSKLWKQCSWIEEPNLLRMHLHWVIYSMQEEFCAQWAKHNGPTC